MLWFLVATEFEKMMLSKWWSWVGLAVVLHPNAQAEYFTELLIHFHVFFPCMPGVIIVNMLFVSCTCRPFSWAYCCIVLTTKSYFVLLLLLRKNIFILLMKHPQQFFYNVNLWMLQILSRGAVGIFNRMCIVSRLYWNW